MGGTILFVACIAAGVAVSGLWGLGVSGIYEMWSNQTLVATALFLPFAIVGVLSAVGRISAARGAVAYVCLLAVSIACGYWVSVAPGPGVVALGVTPIALLLTMLVSLPASAALERAWTPRRP